MEGQQDLSPAGHALGFNVSVDGTVDVFGDVKVFHEKFGLGEHWKSGPKNLDDHTLDFRVKFMAEELTEYIESTSNGDLAGALDALVDLIYVAVGTAFLHGFPIAEAWRRVQEANMSKVRASSADESKRGSSLDVVKPEGWKAPDHTDLVKAISQNKV